MTDSAFRILRSEASLINAIDIQEIFRVSGYFIKLLFERYGVVPE